jgi:hypothetical protein
MSEIPNKKWKKKKKKEINCGLKKIPNLKKKKKKKKKEHTQLPPSRRLYPPLPLP